MEEALETIEQDETSLWAQSPFHNYFIIDEKATFVTTLNSGAGLGFLYGSMPERLFPNEEEGNIITGFGIFTTGTFGARFQPETHNLFMKLAFTPMYVPGELFFLHSALAWGTLFDFEYLPELEESVGFESNIRSN